MKGQIAFKSFMVYLTTHRNFFFFVFCGFWFWNLFKYVFCGFGYCRYPYSTTIRYCTAHSKFSMYLAIIHECYTFLVSYGVWFICKYEMKCYLNLWKRLIVTNSTSNLKALWIHAAWKNTHSSYQWKFYYCSRV